MTILSSRVQCHFFFFLFFFLLVSYCLLSSLYQGYQLLMIQMAGKKPLAECESKVLVSIQPALYSKTRPLFSTTLVQIQCIVVANYYLPGFLGPPPPRPTCLYP